MTFNLYSYTLSDLVRVSVSIAFHSDAHSQSGTVYDIHVHAQAVMCLSLIA